MEIKAGDEVTINGTVSAVSEDKKFFWMHTKSGNDRCLNIEDINTIHPYKEPSKEDHRKGN